MKRLIERLNLIVALGCGLGLGASVLCGFLAVATWGAKNSYGLHAFVIWGGLLVCVFAAFALLTNNVRRTLNSTDGGGSSLYGGCPVRVRRAIYVAMALGVLVFASTFFGLAVGAINKNEIGAVLAAASGFGLAAYASMLGQVISLNHQLRPSH